MGSLFYQYIALGENLKVSNLLKELDSYREELSDDLFFMRF